MKRKLFALLMATLLLAACFCIPANAADPKPTNVSEWVYNEEFTGTKDDLVADGWTFKVADGKTQTVADGTLILSNTTGAEDVINIKSSKLSKTNACVLEVKAKVDFAATGGNRLSVLAWLTDGKRIHSQILKDSFKIQDTAFPATAISNSDEGYHTYRYEILVKNGVVNCNVFMDGKFVTASAMNANNSGAEIRLVTAGGAADDPYVATIDYIKFATVTPPPRPSPRMFPNGLGRKLRRLGSG